MLDGTYDGKALVHRPVAAKELAGRLLFKSPSRGWDNYGGLDDALRISISIAQSHQDNGGQIQLLSQYGSTSIVTEMKSLRCALNILAKQGPDALTFQDKHALSMGKVTIDSLIRQTLIIVEANRPGRISAMPEELLSPDGDEYWEYRVRKLTQNEYTAQDERDSYSSSRQFGGYLADVQKALSSVCYDLGISEITHRQH
jgi:hypothetical protein